MEVAKYPQCFPCYVKNEVGCLVESLNRLTINMSKSAPRHFASRIFLFRNIFIVKKWCKVMLQRHL